MRVSKLKRFYRASLLTVMLGASPLAVAQDTVMLSILLDDGSRIETPINDFNHTIAPGIDAASGLPTGKRQHKPFTIIKRVDNATPLFASMLISNDGIDSWSLKVSRKDAQGRSRLIQTTELAGARVCGAGQGVVEAKHETRERVLFCYQRITWTWHESGTSYEDSWESNP